MPCSVVWVLAFWANVLFPSYFCPCGSSYSLFSKIQYKIVPSSSSVKPTVSDLLPLLICPRSWHLTCCPTSAVVVCNCIPLNSASTPHFPDLGPSSHIALHTVPGSIPSCPYVLELFPSVAYSSAIDVEPVGSSETVNIFYPTWCHIPEYM